MARNSTIQRTTGETDIQLELDLDGDGSSKIDTGVGFLDHMLTLFAKHSGFDLTVTAKGDSHIDDHHTVEDIGICLGSAIQEAVGDKRGICRYGSMMLPMDETLVSTALDLSGRVAFVWNVSIPTEKIGTFDSQLAQEFWQAVTTNAQMNFHANLQYGTNSHHIVEAVFKSAARSLRQAVSYDPGHEGKIPSTKGTL
jgi:imidazoleglycerol-phosphate dehydratase